MIIIKDAIVSNSDMIKNYKANRDKAQAYGKIFIFKNNQPDAVLFSIEAYERIAELLEYVDRIDEETFTKLLEGLPVKGDST